MVNVRKIDKYKRVLGFQSCYANCSNKIWIFWSGEYVVEVIEDKEQQMLLHISILSRTTPLFRTVVYAKCDESMREELWEELRSTANRISGPWGVVGDFNVITYEEEKR